MTEFGWSQLLTQLTHQSPVLFVGLVAAILACVFVFRAPFPCFLTLAGAVVFVAAMIGTAVAQDIVLASTQAGSRSPDEFHQLMATISVAGNFGRAIGLAMLVAAVFIGRRQIH